MIASSYYSPRLSDSALPTALLVAYEVKFTISAEEI